MKESLISRLTGIVLIKNRMVGNALTLLVILPLLIGLVSCNSSGGLFAPPPSATPAATPTPQPTATPEGISPQQDLAAIIESAADGDTIHLGSGVFTLEKGFEITKNLTISGRGPDQTTIVANAPGPNYAAMITNSGSGTLTLQGLKISYAGTDPAAVIFGNSGSLSLSDCYVDGATLSSQGKQLGALHLAGDTITSVQNCRIAGSTSRVSPDKDEKVPGGILIYENARLTMENSEVSDSYLGIYASGTADITVMTSTFRNTFSAISLLENAKGLIHKNSFEGNTKVNLAFFDSSVGSVTENTISGDPESLGVQLNGNSNVLVEKNSISNVISGIIFMDNATGDAISNNLSSFSNAGIMIDGATAPNIESNAFTNDFEGIGIIYQGNAAGKAFNNKLSNLYLGISLDDQAAPNIDANEFSQCRTGIFYQGNSSGTANMNNILLGDIGIGIKSPAQPTLTNNSIQAMIGAIQSDPEDWIGQLSVSGNTLQEGMPEIEIYTVTPGP